MNQISNNHQRTIKTQFIFNSFLFLFSLLILLLFPLTFNPLMSTPLEPSITIPNTSIIESQKIKSFNGSVLVNVVPQENILYGSGPRRNGSGHIMIKIGSCDILDGRWIWDHGFDPIYPAGSCPFVDYTFNCFNNGRSDVGYLRYQWKPYGCDIPRFNGELMLEMLRGKRMVFVGDSLNRNMWESLVCALRMSILDKRRVFEISGKKEFRTEGFYAFKFEDYNCTIEFIKSPFLVQEWKWPNLPGAAVVRQTLRLDMMQDTTSKYHDADFLIFNTGHWWTHHKTKNGESFFQEGDFVHRKLKVTEAFTKALQTWAKWVDTNVNKDKTKVFFVGYSSSHFRGGQWNSGGNCEGETEPITNNDTFIVPNPWIMKNVETVISKMRTPVVYLNITRMTGYRKDGHPSIYQSPRTERRPEMPQDCSHWCLPGVPDSWNQLLYVSLLYYSNVSIAH